MEIEHHLSIHHCETMGLILKFQHYLGTSENTKEPKATKPPSASGVSDESSDDNEEDKPLVVFKLQKRLKKKP